jgi:hypothetical protein
MAARILAILLIVLGLSAILIGLSIYLTSASHTGEITAGLGRQGDWVAFATTAFSAAAIAATFGATLPPSPCRLASQLGSL